MRSIPFLLTSLFLAAGAAAQNHWYVSPTGSDANPGNQTFPFRTINHANVVASNGDVFHLAAATFGDEQGNVLLGNKTVTLVGAGQGVTVIKANTTSDVILLAGLLPGAPDTHRIAVTINGTARVDMRDLTLDNGFSVPGSGRALDLWVGGGADSVIDNVEFTNARANPINGIQGPVAVTVRGDNAGDVTNVTMHNCLVHEYGKGGVVANFNAMLTMDDCRVDGFGHAFSGLAAQNGIQVSRGASCDIRRTTVTNSWYDPTGTTATGILFFDAVSPVLVEDCSFGNCQAGIYFFSTLASTISGGTIRRNRVHTAETGFYTSNVSGLSVTENSFSVSLSGDNNDAWDDAGGNSYSGNNYSSVTVAGAHPLPGLGLAVDATAKPGCRGFASAVATALPAGHSPLGLVVTGLDANGSPDFAAMCQDALLVPVLDIGLNNGAGVFAISSVPFGFATGTPVAIVAGEFNGAPGRDLAVLTRNFSPAITENKVYVFANNGSGSFSLLSVQLLIGATSPSALAAGRLNADAIDDLVVADAGSAGFVPGSATVLLNNGIGTLFAAVPLVAPITVACRGVAIADLNGDTFNDVAVTEGDAVTGRLHIWRGNGAGAFVPFGPSPFATSLNANQVVATDLEGDGDQDLLVSCTRDAFSLIAGDVNVFQNNFSAFKRSEWRCDQGPAALAVGDFDADADPDSQRRDAAVVNLAGGSVTVLGTWTDGCGYGSGGICKLSPTPTGLGIGDVNGDGYADLVWCDASLGSVMVATGVPQARADSYGAGSTGTSGRIPYLRPVGAPGLPIQPNATFGLGLSNGRPLSVAAFAAGVAPAPLVAGNLLISGIGATWVVVTNVFGEAAVPLPIPASPPLIGFPLYCQAGVFDPNATESFFIGVALTKGLKIRVGN